MDILSMDSISRVILLISHETGLFFNHRNLITFLRHDCILKHQYFHYTWAMWPRRRISMFQTDYNMIRLAAVAVSSNGYDEITPSICSCTCR